MITQTNKHEMISIAEVDTSRPNRVGVKLSDGSWMGCFDKKLWPRLEAGANLSVDVERIERDGRTNRNITAILGTASSNGSVSGSQKEQHIIREAALKAACDLHSGSAPGSDVEIDYILHIADRFVRWITEREDEAPF